MRRVLLVLLLLLIIAIAARYFAPTHNTPPQQPGLADLTPQSLPQFKTEFNRDSADLRVILLLSPT